MNLEILNKIIEKDEINFPYGNELCDLKPPIFYCIEQNDYDLVQKCIENDAFINYKCYNIDTQITPLTCAILKRCMDSYNKDNFDNNISYNIIKLLIDHNAYVDETVFFNISSLKYIYGELIYKFEISSLAIAIICNDMNIIKLLIDNGADINKKVDSNKTAIHFAIECKNIDIIKYLIKNGSDLNVKDVMDFTLLDYSISSIEILDYIIGYGYKINKNTFKYLYNTFNKCIDENNVTDEYIYDINLVISLFKYKILKNLKKVISLKNKDAVHVLNKYIINHLNNIPKTYLKELIEKTWHPHRFMSWCLSINDMKDLE